ncbi:MAG: ribose-5-phosphate isomerase RpiA [Betaproteobacteria bacterium]|nr:ribose-5-phosphate isomerase RpiA [Betaproteobacteria bacterium]
MEQNVLKQRAALAALDELVEGSVVGVGSGSTVDLFIDALATRRDRFVGAVSSSRRSTERLRAQGIHVMDLSELIASGLPAPVYVDGADEIDPWLQMIKGGGGALTREKIVAAAFERFVCIVDASKVKPVLGAFALPVDVIPMAARLVARELVSLGGFPKLRDGFATDDGNLVLDVGGLQIQPEAARGFEAQIDAIAGVVTCGLFAARPADVVLIARAEGIERVMVGDSTG